MPNREARLGSARLRSTSYPFPLRTAKPHIKKLLAATQFRYNRLFKAHTVLDLRLIFYSAMMLQANEANIVIEVH